MRAAEAGTVWGIRFVLFLCTVFGRRVARAFVHVLAFYYFAFSASARRSSRRYLCRLRGAPVGFWAPYRHILTFAEVTLDRLFFARGRNDLFEVTSHGREHLSALHGQKKGALLLFSHVGSFEAARFYSEEGAYRVNVLGYFRNARMINATLEKLNPNINVRLIDLTPDSVDFIFAVKERIKAGEIVSTMGDRVGAEGKSATATFFGSPARFPTGPFLLAHLLACPVYLSFGLYFEPNRYELFCEPFAEKIALPREGRDQALAALAQRYATRLEEYCRRAEYNWFNFFEFWEEPKKEERS
jgi:predicted LPLAT superfamily acyltransferase